MKQFCDYRAYPDSWFMSVHSGIEHQLGNRLANNAFAFKGMEKQVIVAENVH